MKYLFLLITSIFLHAQAQVLPVLPELSQQFTNIRDFTVFQNQAWFSAQSPLGDLSVIVQVEKNNDAWRNPQVASFSGKYHDLEPFITHDGLSLYFASNRPENDNDNDKDYDLWVVSRKDLTSAWPEPRNLGSQVNSDGNEFYPSLTKSGNLYFTANKSDSKGKDDIYFSEFKDGVFQKSYSLGSEINTDGDEYNAYVSKDERYLIFGAYKRADSLGSGDLYISRKDSDGNWSQAINLSNKVNSMQMDYCPFVDEENQVLYFTSRRKNFDKTEFINIGQLLQTFNSIENGLSRIYQVKLDL